MAGAVRDRDHRGAVGSEPRGVAEGWSAPAPPATAAVGAQSAERRYLNRELSWLDFNSRVLTLAEDPDRPLLERARFLAIFSRNLDEFSEIRVAGLEEQVTAGFRTPGPDGLDTLDVLRRVRSRVEQLVARQTRTFVKDVALRLEEAGIGFSDWEDLDDTDREALRRVFEEQVFPVLTPLAVDPAHPFPYISNLSLNLAVKVRDPERGTERFARVKVPPLLPRFVPVNGGDRFVPIEQVIAAHLDALFPGMEIVARHPFRVTRNADFELQDEDEDLLEAIESVLHRRTKFGHVVRLEVEASMPPDVLDVLGRELELTPAAVTRVDGPLDLTGLFALYSLDRPELKDPPLVPSTQAVLGGLGTDLFAVLREQDVLVHHPYDSFATSIEALIDQAARDPNVLAIKQTIYRTAGADSAILQSLVEAARSGKQVVVIVEVKARFDEEANIERAQTLEEAGAHVVYGLVGLKTHAKILLVVRQEPDGIRRYCHVGTGNYNPRTATAYEDIGLLSSDPALGADLSQLFNYLTGYSRPRSYRCLLVAPDGLRDAVVARIRAEAAKGASGRIIMKMNALVDTAIIDELYEASQAGSRVDLVVRGVCCLRPGVPGLSENIRVRSIVGRFLEHSRVLRFGADPAAAEYLIGSSDLMPRNLDRRVEALVTVTAPALRARLAEALDVELADDVLAWELGPDDSWYHVETVEGIDTQAALVLLAAERARPRVSTTDDELLSFSGHPAGAPDVAGDTAPDPPDDTDRAPTISTADVEELVRGVLARNVAALVEHSSALRTGDDPEDVHQARVALRRLRAAERTFHPFLESWPEELGDRLRDAGRVLGAARDLDVLAERLGDHVEGLPASDGPAGERILHHLNQQRFTARVTGIAYTTGPEWAALMRDLAGAASCPVSTPEGSDAGDVLRTTVRKEWRRVAKLAKVLGDGSDEELHELRIRAKRARYAAEAVAPLFDDEPRGLASALADLQDALGRHHDAVWATAWLRKAAPSSDPTVSFVAGELTGIEHAAADRARRRASRAWKAARRERLRRWL